GLHGRADGAPTSPGAGSSRFRVGVGTRVVLAESRPKAAPLDGGRRPSTDLRPPARCAGSIHRAQVIDLASYIGEAICIKRDLDQNRASGPAIVEVAYRRSRRLESTRLSDRAKDGLAAQTVVDGDGGRFFVSESRRREAAAAKHRDELQDRCRPNARNRTGRVDKKAAGKNSAITFLSLPYIAELITDGEISRRSSRPVGCVAPVADGYSNLTMLTML